MTPQIFPDSSVPVGCVLTLPATGSEWNSNFVISRRSINAKLSSGNALTFPVFSLLDPTYTLTLPPRQLSNGVFDAIIHCIDQFLTGQEVPLMDLYWMSTIKELVTIGPEVVKEGSPIELRERLMVAASFALNVVFTLGKEECWAIHEIGHQLTAKYGIDHGATLAIVGPPLLLRLIEPRKSLMAKSAEFVFGVRTGTEDEKARAFVEKLKEFIVRIGQPLKVSDWKGATIRPGDVEEVTRWVMNAEGNAPFGWHGLATEDIVRSVLTEVIV
jgi:alcohol dehydrogenase YqhD (iron-dependent ADH family)